MYVALVRLLTASRAKFQSSHKYPLKRDFGMYLCTFYEVILTAKFITNDKPTSPPARKNQTDRDVLPLPAYLIVLYLSNKGDAQQPPWKAVGCF